MDTVLEKGFSVVLTNTVNNREGQKTFLFHENWRLSIIFSFNTRKINQFLNVFEGNRRDGEQLRAQQAGHAL